jgi:hypothetical protein
MWYMYDWLSLVMETVSDCPCYYLWLNILSGMYSYKLTNCFLNTIQNFTEWNVSQIKRDYTHTAVLRLYVCKIGMKRKCGLGYFKAVLKHALNCVYFKCRVGFIPNPPTHMHTTWHNSRKEPTCCVSVTFPLWAANMSISCKNKLQFWHGLDFVSPPHSGRVSM